MPANGLLDCWDLSIPEPLPSSGQLIFTPRRRAQHLKDVAANAAQGTESPRDTSDPSSTHLTGASTARQRASTPSLLSGTPRGSSPAWVGQQSEENIATPDLEESASAAHGSWRSHAWASDPSDAQSLHGIHRSVSARGSGGEERGRAVSGGGQDPGDRAPAGGTVFVDTSRQQKHALRKTMVSARHLANPLVMELSPEFKGRLAAARCKIDTGARAVSVYEPRPVVVCSSGGDDSDSSGSEQDESNSGGSSDEEGSSG